ncbi:alpha/beta hydrolase [Flavobacterium sp. SUN052]|uniref:alpha/beta fold hydrolase n=1 Tax=Flavobacterium sp. SUN052 TaxID=3002441 RepID=UPI00237D4E95|nr:alpha/beta hydrolase [Flavobacterium sp. SUN052]MEC4005778.1 alpha/beta hydrolase [Flavobacterium sp. SUN052]
MTKKNPKQAQTLKIPRIIVITAKFLEVISTKLVTRFAAKLFTTPIKYKIPKREFLMDKNSKQQKLFIPKINKEIMVYQYGTSNRKILLVHGWSGRGTQLYKIADELLNIGFATISFDAPAHGKSKGNTTIMVEFIECILEIEKKYGYFEFAIGHSLGGMSVLNAIKHKLNIEKAVIIGSGDSIQDITDDFIKNLQLKPNISNELTHYFENKYQLKMNDFSSSVIAKKVKIPVLIIHDENDEEVNVKSAHAISKVLNQSKLIITKGLGHRKILGNNKVIQNIVQFITE